MGELSQALRWYPPFRVRHLAVKRVRKLRATLSWGKVRRGDGRLAGYRVYRDGAVYRQVKPRRRSIPVRVTPGTHVFRVIAADTRGAMGLPSRSVRVRVRHSAPTVPGRLRVGRVSDGTRRARLGVKPQAQLADRRLPDLAQRRAGRAGRRDSPPTSATWLPRPAYRFSVAAVDRWGYVEPIDHGADDDRDAASDARQACTRSCWPRPTRASATSSATTGRSAPSIRRTSTAAAANGGIIGKDDPLVTRWAQMRRIVVMPRFNCQHGPTLNMILRDPALREATLTNLVGLVQQHGYDGINIDFESGYETDRDVLTSFVAELGAAAARARQAIGASRCRRSSPAPRRDAPASTTIRTSAASRTTCS